MISRRAQTIVLSLAAGAFTASCGGPQSVVNAAGIQAGRLESLWWIFFWITAIVYVMVAICLIGAWITAPRSSEIERPATDSDERRETRARTIVTAAVAITGVTLVVLMVTSFRAGTAINSLSENPPDLAVKITGHQWWWEVEYEDEQSPGNNVTTANELHVPVGRTVKVMLQSNDVIHSLWMPNLHGKKDLIPNYPTTFYFEADKPGTYWGQCAEFCGYQHAKMRIMITAEPSEDFEKWLNAGRQTPPPPSGDAEKRGQQIFTTSVCAQCHTISGTSAGGKVGPNLTHIASRPYIGAGSLQNTNENLAEWITDSQHVKPGNKMPMNLYSDDDLASLVAYLRSLK